MDRALSFDIRRAYPRGPTVAARADVPLGDGSITVLFGPSGSGKTTVLRAIAGVDRPDEGRIRFGGEVWFDGASRAFVPPQKRRVGLLFQEYALFPHLSVQGNIGYGLGRLRPAEREARIREAAERMRVGDLLRRRPAELSGGQRQRVALARALAPRPRLLLLDEPLSALDAPTRELLRGELRRTLEESGAPAIVVTHDRVEALAIGDRMVVLAGGRVRQVGAVHEVFSAPADAEVALAVGTENVLPVRLANRNAGLVRVRAGPLELIAVDPGHLEDEAFACIRAEDIILEEAPGAPTSAQNLLVGAVATRADEGVLVRIGIDCGARLVALVTRRSADALSLVPGRRIAALVKAPSVRLVPRAR
ncbi:MAG TPA: ABC transporter ATP-binding protein [Myxococcaceae bacterium]|nr:ABC transporter ATP-binding protein [Myxococcaceae bacterium]